MYAADEDIRTRGPTADAFEVRLTPVGGTSLSLRLPASGVAAEQGGAPAVVSSIDIDGTPDAGGVEGDEEWQAFAAVPWSRLGVKPEPGTQLDVELSRCDVPRDGVRRCGRWQGRLALSSR